MKARADNHVICKRLEVATKKHAILSELETKLVDVEKVSVAVKNKYSSETLGQMESLFHIYSGRLIQNYQRGLGLFIDTDEGKSSSKNKILSFFTADGTEYDAVLSMSSGQVAALTLAFFLSLNAKYANTGSILIDDPTQSMDEINIASLRGLLRVECKHLINRIIPPSITFTYDHFNHLRRSSCDEHHSNGLNFLKPKVKAIYQ